MPKKIQKLSNDVLRIVNEDKSIHDLKGAPAKQTLEKIMQVKLPEKVESHAFRLYHDICNSKIMDDASFIEFAKSTDYKEVKQIVTERKVFNESAYNKVVEAQKKKTTDLVLQQRSIFNDNALSYVEKYDALQKLNKQINESASVIIPKNDDQFYMNEVINVTINVDEALEHFRNVHAKCDAMEQEAKDNAYKSAIEKDKLELAQFTDEDLKIAKSIYKVNVNMHCQIYGATHLYNKVLMSFDSIEDYINRERDVQYESPKMQFTETDRIVFDFIWSLRRQYIEDKCKREVEKLMNQ